MAKADSVPSSSRQLITGESANQSTNLRAANLSAAREEPANRGHLIGGSHVSAIISGEGARPLQLWQEKRVDQPQDLLKCHYYGANAAQAPAGSSPETLFYAALFLWRLLKWIVLILLLLVSRNKRSRNNALEKASSNQLIRSKPRERLR